MQPSYFYHLAFELYPPPNDTEAYVPPPGTNIFEADLPAHSVISWKTTTLKRPSHRRAHTEAFDSKWDILDMRGSV